jgi:hypothetical protein
MSDPDTCLAEITSFPRPAVLFKALNVLNLDLDKIDS